MHGFLVALRVSSTCIVSLPIQRWLAFLKHLHIHIVTYTFRQQRLEDTRAQPRKHIDSLYHIALVTVSNSWIITLWANQTFCSQFELSWKHSDLPMFSLFIFFIRSLFLTYGPLNLNTFKHKYMPPIGVHKVRQNFVLEIICT